MYRIIRSSTDDRKKYIRFGDIPENGVSVAHRGDAIYHNGEGLSVWNCCEVNDMYFPILSDPSNEDAVTDYFEMLFSNKPVYLVTGTELPDRGFDGEPLITDVDIVKELTDDYNYLKGIMSK